MDAAIIVALVTGSFSLVTFILTRYFTQKDKRLEEEHKEDAKYEQLEEEQERAEQDIKRLASSVEHLVEMQESQNSLLDLLKSSSQSTLRSNIIQIYNKYTSKEYGYLPIYERENLQHLTNDYYALNGNGVIPDLVKEMEELPSRKQDDDEEE